MKQVFSGRGLTSGLVVALLFVAVPSADHSWGNYHWSRGSGAVSLQVGNNVSAAWDRYVFGGNGEVGALGDWNQSNSLVLTAVAGGANPKNCRPTPGRIEVCNSKYGNNGWLGIAQIWVSGGHISQAITKLNDTYFNTATYDTPAWRRLVACQEIAHDFGLDHQDENFDNANLGSCMDYTGDPDGPPSNEHPNQHDYEQITQIYSHSHASASTAAVPGQSSDHPSQWGRLLRQNEDRRLQVFELDLGNGHKVITHVYWADPERDARGRH